MQNKTFKIILFIALFLAVILAWVLIRDAQRKKISDTPVNTGLENPFGGSTGTNDLKGDSKTDSLSAGGSSNSNNGSNTQPSDNIVIVEDNPVLKKLSDAPVAGFTFVNEERDIEVDNSTTPNEAIVEVYDFSGYKTIRFGDTADEIVQIKTILNRQTPSPALKINNSYDTDMKNAVIDFQNKNGLTGDGVIGGKTYAKLNALQGLNNFSSTKKPKNTEIVPLARYVDQASGLLYQIPLNKNEDKLKVTATSIPRVKQAFFDSTGSRVVMRYLKDDLIETYLVNLTFPKMPDNLTKEEKAKFDKTASVQGEFLPENIKTISLSNDEKSLFYMNPVSGGVAGITYNFATKAKKQIFETPLTEWMANWGSDSKIDLTTKASGLVDGFSYLLDAKTGSFVKDVGSKKGLTTLLSPDGKKLLYSEYSNNQISTSVVDLVSNKVTSISPATLPEKCVWTKDSKKIYCAAAIKGVAFLYPDDWYKGKISFDDSLWVIDTNDMTGNIIYDFTAKSGQHIDAINLQLNSNENYLGFINKKDGILWGFDLAR